MPRIVPATPDDPPLRDSLRQKRQSGAGMIEAVAIEDVELEGLGRLDAVVLIAGVTPDDDPRPRGLVWRVWVLMRYRVRGALRRLEQRQLIEPGWSIRIRRWPPAQARVTPEGLRVARVAAVTLELEGFAGPVGIFEAV